MSTLRMSPDAHPQVAQALEQLHQFSSALESQMRRTHIESFTATDETETVEVTINGQRCIVGLDIEDGLLRLGSHTVQQRINEALHNAQAGASAALRAQQAQLFASLTELAGSLQKTVGLI
ncbi:YbaB/EbfC family nucleoid-associated protein [Mycobacterium sp. ACS4054]|uniref:YbaB/EbfC family nucleoid-associated protein n=1 Tax=Mycobacterium sp. ACS4054 TaxID=1834119 RepID=UPI000A4E34AC|nr:YbaB/EbfC family nucleoid-associated protein [Mycobacterium sp. ACS4054]